MVGPGIFVSGVASRKPMLAATQVAQKISSGFGSKGGAGFGKIISFHSAGGRRNSMPRSCCSKSLSSPSFMGSKLFIHGTQEGAEFV